jgi:hypothetical protein
MKHLAIAAVLLLTCGATLAQQSASFHLTESSFNAAGTPSQGTILASPGLRLTFGSIGEPAVSSAPLASSSYRMDTSFANAYPPPGEALGLYFVDRTTLQWSPEKSVGTYNLYRDSLAELKTGSAGTCLQVDLDDEQAVDGSSPPQGAGWFYLVTARNRLGEEGTRGRTSWGSERSRTNACP